MNKHYINNVPKTKENDNEKSKAVLKILRDRFSVFATFKPLRIQIHRSIHAEIPTLSQRDIIKAVGLHVRHTRYLAALAQGGARFNLDGSQNGVIPPHHQEKARLELNKRQAFKKSQGYRKNGSGKKSQESQKQPTRVKLVARVVRVIRQPTEGI